MITSERDPQIAIEKELYEFVVREAKRNKRTIKGQVSVMIELAKEREEREKLSREEKRA